MRLQHLLGHCGELVRVAIEVKKALRGNLVFGGKPRMLACNVTAGAGKSLLLLIDVPEIDRADEWVQDLDSTVGAERAVALIGHFDHIPWDLLLAFDHVRVAKTLEEARKVAQESPWRPPLAAWERFLRKAGKPRL